MGSSRVTAVEEPSYQGYIGCRIGMMFGWMERGSRSLGSRAFREIECGMTSAKSRETAWVPTRQFKEGAASLGIAR